MFALRELNARRFGISAKWSGPCSEFGGPSEGVVVWTVAMETTSSARPFASRHSNEKSVG